MGYDLHLLREPPITLEEWLAAVATIDALRPTTTAHHGPGDLDIRIEPRFLARLLGDKTSWYPFVRFSHGSGSFRAAFDPDDPKDPVRCALGALARKLGARIEGDDGEIYDW